MEPLEPCKLRDGTFDEIHGITLFMNEETTTNRDSAEIPLHLLWRICFWAEIIGHIFVGEILGCPNRAGTLGYTYVRNQGHRDPSPERGRDATFGACGLTARNKDATRNKCIASRGS